MKNELLTKFLNNQCTESELSEALNWITDDALNEECKSWIFDNWNSYHESGNLEEDEKFTTMFDKIQVRIDHIILNRNLKKGKTIKLFVVANWITRVAAVLLLPILTFLIYTLSEMRNISDQYTNLATDSLEVITPICSRTVVQLSDGSVVHLNYGSKIKYPQFFSGDTRKVVLIGEGLFIVAPNPEKPFIVKAGNLNIKALGTTFNVSAYPDDDVIETTLVNGKVILEQINLNEKTKTIGTMTPGQHIEYNVQSYDISSTDGNVEKYISWTDGKLIFKDTPIHQVAERLSRMFNVDFEINDELKEYNYTVTLEDESLSQILDLIAIATPIKYKMLPRKKLPDGSLSRQKITLEKRN